MKNIIKTLAESTAPPADATAEKEESTQPEFKENFCFKSFTKRDLNWLILADSEA